MLLAVATAMDKKEARRIETMGKGKVDLFSRLLDALTVGPRLPLMLAEDELLLGAPPAALGGGGSIWLKRMR